LTAWLSDKLAQAFQVLVPDQRRPASTAIPNCAPQTLEVSREQRARQRITKPVRQSMLIYQQCGYPLYRTSTQASKQKINYYRCVGSDEYRHLKGAVCANQPIR
jgi:site-specific DNA recombinase